MAMFTEPATNIGISNVSFYFSNTVVTYDREIK